MKNQTKNEITVAEFAALCNLSTRRVRQLASENKIPPIKKGKLELQKATTMLFAYYQRVSEEMTSERLALVKATRETKQLELSREQGKSISRDLAEFTFRTAIRDYHRLVRQEIEINSPAARREKLIELGVAAEVLQPFNAFDIVQSQAVIDRIESECEKRAKEIEV